MTTKQKIWMWIFIAMFALPEILWSPITNFSYSIWRGGNIPVFLRNNFLLSTDHRLLAVFVLLVQSIGALLALILALKLEKNFVQKLFFSVIFFVVFILSFLVFYFLLATLNMGF